MTKVTTIEAAGYIITDKNQEYIWGMGATVDEAWQMVIDGAGVFLDADGVERDDEEVFTTDYRTYGASAALIAQLWDFGGTIGWGKVGGVACTVEQEEASIAA